MTTQITITGTGIPAPVPGVAGAGVHIRHGELSMQIDAGRNTAVRLTEAGEHPRGLTQVFLTHHHSDHLLGLADLVITRWILQGEAHVPLAIIAPEGPTSRFAENIVDQWADDLHIRAAHVGRSPMNGVDVQAFVPAAEPTVVFEHDDVRVLAVAVHHEPVTPSVAYRVETPDGAVVVSGDTRVCDEVAVLSAGADLVIHEAVRVKETLGRMSVVTGVEDIVEYHADTIELGAQAEEHGFVHLVLTHLIPPAQSDEDRAGFEADVRAGGYTGTVTVAKDLTSFTLG